MIVLIVSFNTFLLGILLFALVIVLGFWLSSISLGEMAWLVWSVGLTAVGLAFALFWVLVIYGSKAFYIQTLSSTIAFAGTVEESAALYVFASSFVLLGLIPCLVVMLLFREPLAAYGIQLGDARFGWRAVAVVTPVMIVSAYPSASMSEFRAEYPINPLAGESAVHFLEHALLYLFFYLGWEFCFRGFVQFGLRGSMGDWNAILVQTALSCVLHIGKPAGEIYSSILGALVWGVVAFRSRSLLYPLLTHWALGLSLDFFIVTSSPHSMMP